VNTQAAPQLDVIASPGLIRGSMSRKLDEVDMISLVLLRGITLPPPVGWCMGVVLALTRGGKAKGSLPPTYEPVTRYISPLSFSDPVRK